ncbi:MAG TPA: GrlR family regulatory protein [Stellaceae bacterium]|nr:GrlR family regulatory protein [Stellaceae bacterium]
MAEIDALWTIQFDVAGEWRTGGIVIFDGGRVFGGDSHYYYVGRYRERGTAIEGEARIVHYSGPLATGFGSSPDFTVLLEGRHNGEVITGHIHKPGSETAKLAIRCVRREAIPPGTAH